LLISLPTSRYFVDFMLRELQPLIWICNRATHNPPFNCMKFNYPADS
jgi:hypothetical protein